MKDKKSFEEYITEKRKQNNLTQEELASVLYIAPSAVSKWERGLTYPDITLIVPLCKALNITEHEFFTACDDISLKEEKKEIQKYRKIKKWILNIINISYFISIITCFICNVAAYHKLSWFLIVLVSILISFSITSLPHYLNKNKYLFLKVSIPVTLLVYLLLFTVNYVISGNFLIESFKITTFVFSILWIDILICTFTKINKYYKISISLILIALVTIFTNPFCEKVLNIHNEDNNIPNIICAGVMIFTAILLSLKKLKDK